MIEGFQKKIIKIRPGERFPEFGLELQPKPGTTIPQLQALIGNKIRPLLDEHGFVALRGATVDDSYNAVDLSGTQFQRFHFDRPVRGTHKDISILFYPLQESPRLTDTAIENREVAIKVLIIVLEEASEDELIRLHLNLQKLPRQPPHHPDQSFAEYIIHNNLLQQFPEDLYGKFESKLLETAHIQEYGVYYNTFLFMNNAALLHTRVNRSNRKESVPPKQGRLSVLKGQALVDPHAFRLAV